MTATWLNEKLVFIQSWGRVFSDDRVIDVERGTLLYSQTADYGYGCIR